MKPQLQGYLIEKYNNMNNAYTSSRMIEEAYRQDIDLKLIGVYDSFWFDGNNYNSCKLLKKRDFSIIRYKDGHLKDLLSGLGEKQFNENNCITKYSDKYLQFNHLNLINTQIPTFVLGSLDLEYHFITQKVGEPFVVKGLRSSQGKEVFLVSNNNDFARLRDFYKDEYKEFIFQELIKSSFGTDLRVFVIKGEAVACMRRTSLDSFKANYALGGKIEKFQVDSQIEAISKEIYKKTNLFYFGLDLLFGDSGYFFCEINVTPGIEGIEKSTGINVTKKLISKIKEKL